MSTELARDIIAQSRVNTSPSRLSISITSLNEIVLKISAPIVNGVQLLQVTSTPGEEPLSYNAKDNLEGAARFVEWSLYCQNMGPGYFDAVMYVLEEDGSEPDEGHCSRLLEWSECDEGEALFQKVKSMLKVLLSS